MKINHFIARNVHGHYNFELDFSRQVTFLIGDNGSGKTSALKLMQAAFTLDLATLYSIKFSYLSIIIERSNKQHQLIIQNIGQSLQLSFDQEESDSLIPLPSDEEFGHYSKNGRLDEYFEERRFHFLRNTTRKLREFLEFEHPLFLGLERKTSNIGSNGFYQYRGDDYLEFRQRTISRGRRDPIEGIDNCERLIEQAYRNFRRISDARTGHLTSIVVDSVFDYIEFEPDLFLDGTDLQLNEVRKLLLRRKEIEQFSISLGGSDKATEKINLFFEKINQLIETHEGKDHGRMLNIELLLNKAQIQRMLKILEEMERQRAKAERIYSPIKQFVNIMNEFFDSSEKIIEVDSVGRLRVIQKGSQIPLAALSSGEKQLLILISHSMFAKRSGSIFIVDEPELSLHLRWQEMLIDSLMSNAKNNQFIFATHSPEIIGFRKDNCLRVS